MFRPHGGSNHVMRICCQCIPLFPTKDNPSDFRQSRVQDSVELFSNQSKEYSIIRLLFLLSSDLMQQNLT